MATKQSNNQLSKQPNWLKANYSLLLLLIFLILFPLIVSLADGQSFSAMLASDSGNSKFYQGLMIEIFILAIYAISYDLLLGITGLLSFGHAMFFGVGAYLTGIMLKSFGWSLLPTLGLVVLASVLQALLFSIVLPRVKGITFALVTLGMATVFWIVIQSNELSSLAGAEVGLQNVPKPAWLDPATHRLLFYFVALALVSGVYLFFRRFLDSPTGHVCVAIRENEDRARMLGFNTFKFKLVALIVSAIAANLAGAMHALFQPIVIPNVASMGFTVAALLMILMGGIGTLSGALLGAAFYKLLSFFLDHYLATISSYVIGIVYVVLVMYVPYGIVGTWQMRSLEWRQGWQRLIKLFAGR